MLILNQQTHMKKIKPVILPLLFIAIALVASECKHDISVTGIPNPDPNPDPPGPTACDTLYVTFTKSVLPILQQNCFSCHSGPNPSGNIDFTDYNQLAYIAQTGILLAAIRHEEGTLPMPQNTDKLDDCSIATIAIWVRDTTFTDPGGGGNDNGHPCDADTVYFQNEVLPLIISNCAVSGCHDQAGGGEGKFLLVDYASIVQNGKIKPGNPDGSKLYRAITQNGGDDRMPPPPASALSTEQKNIIKNWIEQGALNNYCDEECDTTNVTYSGTIQPIIELNCYGCHSGPQPSGGISLADYNAVVVQSNNGNLFSAVNHDPGFSPMPKNAPKLADCKINEIKIWIENGTPNN